MDARPARHDEDLDVLTIRDVFTFVRRGLVPALIVGVLAAGVATLLAVLQDPVYEARATVLMSSSASRLESFGTTLVTAPELAPNAYVIVATGRAHLREALQAAGVEDPSPARIEALQEHLNVVIRDDGASALLYVDVRSEDAAQAAVFANAVAQELVRWDKGRAEANLTQIITALQSQIAALDQQIAELQAAGDAVPQDQLDGRIALRAQQQQLSYARTLANSAVGLLSMLEPAFEPTRPVAPVPARSAALAAALAVMLLYALLLLRDLLDTRLRNSDDIARVTGSPVLAEFPQLPEGSRRLPREATGYLRTNVSFATTDAHPKVLLVTSPLQSEGKSSVALSLAESFARSDHRTLLVDADLRKPVLADEYGLRPGSADPLHSWLDDPDADHAPATVQLGTTVRTDVIPTFHAAPSPSELLNRGFLRSLERWRGTYDVIVIDSAPILPVADTLSIAPMCTGTILAASTVATDRRKLQAASDLLRRIGVRVLGAVATQMEPDTSRNAATGSGYGYGYGYGYGAAEDQDQSRPGTLAPATERT